MGRQWQELFNDKTYSFVGMMNPDFVKLGEARGIDSFRAHTKKEIRTHIRTARKIKGAVVIDCNIAMEENVFPMVPSGVGINNMVLNNHDK